MTAFIGSVISFDQMTTPKIDRISGAVFVHTGQQIVVVREGVTGPGQLGYVVLRVGPDVRSVAESKFSWSE